MEKIIANSRDHCDLVGTDHVKPSMYFLGLRTVARMAISSQFHGLSKEDFRLV